jgi:hypothetical protein
MMRIPLKLLHVASIGAIFIVVDDIFVINNPSGQILLDEICHGVTGLLIWNAILCEDFVGLDEHALSIFFVYKRKHVKELLLAVLMACAVDVDHFIAAASLHLSDATNLQARPFGHAFIFIFAASLVSYLIFKSTRLAWQTFTALLCHQLRDALRRGLWLWPLKFSTPAFSLCAVLACYLSVVIMVHHMISVSSCREERTSSSPLLPM